MPDVQWSLMCDYCLIDHSGRPSLIGIFDRLGAFSVPVQHPQLFIVTQWSSQPHQAFKTETRLWTPTEQLLATTGEVPVAPNPDGRNLTINQFRAVMLERPGQYLVELLAEGETARYYPWQLVVQPGPS